MAWIYYEIDYSFNETLTTAPSRPPARPHHILHNQQAFILQLIARRSFEPAYLHSENGAGSSIYSNRVRGSLMRGGCPEHIGAGETCV